MARTRTAAFSRSGGGKAIRYLNGSLVVNNTQTPLKVYESVCDDSTGFGVDHALRIIRTDATGIQPLNGKRTISIDTSKEYQNWYPGTAVSGLIVPGHLSYTLPSVGSVATEVLARSNPSKPYLSVPNFLYELKDLPGMIQDIGKLKLYARRYYYSRKTGSGQKTLTARDIANHQLSVQMGWSPLIGDLRKLLDFQSKVDRKIRDLDRLFNHNGGLHRTVSRVSGWSTVVESTSNNAIESGLGDILRCDRHSVTTARIWGSVRWTSNSPPSIEWSDKKIARTARNIVFGLNINPKAIWDAVPWTWMIGWFTNVDSYLQAHTNVIPVRASTPCVMRHVKTVHSETRTDVYQDVYRGGYGSTIRESKERFLNAGTLSASIPFLGARELSILGALAIQRRR